MSGIPIPVYGKGNPPASAASYDKEFGTLVEKRSMHYAICPAIFNWFGAPLYLKRYNVGNLNHAAGNDGLANYFVMPDNSPDYCPPDNGSIEEAQTELKN